MILSATQPKEETEKKTRIVVLKKARYKDGVLLPAETKTVEEEIKVYTVYTTFDGQTERHVFTTKSGAENYYRSVR